MKYVRVFRGLKLQKSLLYLHNSFPYSNTEKKIDGHILMTDKCSGELQKLLIPDVKDRYKFILALSELKYATNTLSDAV